MILVPWETARTGDIYRHYRGGLYKVVGNATMTVNDEPMVVYLAVGGGARAGLWVRALREWNEEIRIDENFTVTRFTWHETGPENR